MRVVDRLEPALRPREPQNPEAQDPELLRRLLRAKDRMPISGLP